VAEILVLAPEDDSEAALVAEELAARGHRPAWLDTVWFPSNATVTATLESDGWRGLLTTPNGPIDLDKITAAYYGQPEPFTFPPEMSEGEQRFATIETRFGLGGLLTSLPVRWVSHPSAVADAEYRIRQMAVANRCGLLPPPSLITSDCGAARRFIKECDTGAVYKTIMHKIISDAGGVKLIYTTPVNPASLDDRISLAPHLFQQNVSKAFDARVVVTSAGACLGVAIHSSDPDAKQDWRTRYDTLMYQKVDVPTDVATGCVGCLAELGIELGVFDFSVDDAGAWWFLEVNPAGRWAWLQEATGLPIAEAIADLLTGGEAR
jgi:hypothetical protein